MSKSVEHIEASMRRLKRLGSVLSAVFAVFMVVTIAIAVACGVIAGHQMSLGAHFTSFGVLEGEDFNIHIFPAVMWLFIALVLEATLLSIFRDMSRGESPFTVRHARLIAGLGGLFVVNALLALIFRGNVLLDFAPTLSISYWPNPFVLLVGGQNGVAIDVGSLLAALVCFSISIMWRYAALLQEQTDELV
ncbi:hypothetical protein [Collinsella sp. An2]|uniref:hypothetical protein n=1 Tax=Collinsella sp. An2 TaxID=1965585 RepID=UPI000B38D0F8|nr:hypothetical protein [Collinsella sp. An2]OUP09460.1 hypothetical protein B5F33_04640 [Collinsella sp. An2]